MANEIKKGSAAELEAVIGLVNGLSTLESMSRHGDEIKKSMSRDFIWDFISIGCLLVLAAYLSTVTAYDNVTLAITCILVIIPVYDFMNFVQDIRQCFSLEDTLSG